MNLPSFITGLNPDGTSYIRAGWGIFASHIETGGSRYMSRWIVQTPYGTVKLHHIHRPDADEHPHDHVADFWSLILSGGYREERTVLRGTTLAPDVRDALLEILAQDGISGIRRIGRLVVARRFARGEIVRRRAEEVHRIVAVEPNTWTLVLFGPKVRSWGFLTPEGWVPWRTYLGPGSKQ